MASTKSITTKSKKRKRVPKFDDLLQCIDNEPDSYKTAWNELKSRIIELNEHATQAVPPVNSSQSLCHRYNRTNFNSLRPQLSRFTMLTKSLTYTIRKKYFGLRLTSYLHRSISLTALIEYWQSLPDPVQQMKDFLGQS